MSMPGRSSPARRRPLRPRDRRLRSGIGSASMNAAGTSARARLHRHADFELLVGGHPIGRGSAGRLVVLGNGDQHARIRTLELAADREALDERVIDAQLDLVLVSSMPSIVLPSCCASGAA